MTVLRSEHGFTLIEAMIAVAVLAIGVLILDKNIIAQIFYNNSTKLASSAVGGTSSLVERLQTLPFNHGWLQDLATGDLNSLDDTVASNGQLIAAHAARLDANGLIVRDAANNEAVINKGQNVANLPADGILTVFWNVVDNAARPNMKVIRVISRWRDKDSTGSVQDGDQMHNRQMAIDCVKTRF